MTPNQQLILNIDSIKSRIFNIKDTQVMLDFHLAEIYNVETRVLNQAVKRNIERFPEDFMFQLSESEWNNLKSQFVISSEHGGRRNLPYAFAEQGIAGLSSILKSETAIHVNIGIMRAFVNMRKIFLDNSIINSRFEKIEHKLLNNEQKFEELFKALENQNNIPKQGVYFEGQVFDAYYLLNKIIKSAQESIIIIDNYIDENVLNTLTKNENNVRIRILTKNISTQLKLDIEKYNQQFKNLEVIIYTKAHDRFIIIDNNEYYHLGASLKDLGKKMFAFTKLEDNSIITFNKIKELI